MGEPMTPTEFGPNGAVLNSETMTPALRKKYLDQTGALYDQPKVWPQSAIYMVILGGVLGGIGLASLFIENSPTLLAALPGLGGIVMGIAQYWRSRWAKRRGLN